MPQPFPGNPQPSGFDFIGDLHGQWKRARALLSRLGYRRRDGIFRHAGRKAVFLGDILNRGPHVADTVRMVWEMEQAGSALCLLGNHEFWTWWHERRVRAGLPSFLPQKTLDAIARSRASFGKSGREWERLLRWIERLPVVFNARLPGGECAFGVHACLDIAAATRIKNNRILAIDALTTNPGVRFYALMSLIEGPAFFPPGSEKAARIRWWLSRLPESMAEAAFTARALPERPSPPPSLRSKLHPLLPGHPPVFFGHYGFPKPARPILPNAACLDLGAGQGGPVAAYSWSGEQLLLKSRFFTA